MSPEVAGRFFTTEPPGKPTHCMILIVGCSVKGKTMEIVNRSVVPWGEKRDEQVAYRKLGRQ